MGFKSAELPSTIDVRGVEMDMHEKFAMEKYFSSEEMKKPKSLLETCESPEANVSLT